ncbi:MAG TPA: hypothetical protein VFZ25_03630 [Chloroflexota bacterium]|nr:hypothetical protein [Chloroflexota bacterium]
MRPQAINEPITAGSTKRTTPSPSPTILRLSVALSALAGFGVGLTLLTSIAIGSAGDLPFQALAQAHGQVQTLGFIGLFIVGTAAVLLPGFLAAPLRRQRFLLVGGWLVALGLLARISSQPLDLGLPRSGLLGLSAIGETLGFGLCLYGLADLPRRSLQPSGLWRRLLIVGVAFLALGLALNLVAVGTLVAGHALVPAALDAALVEAELWGFAGFLVFGISRKLLPHLLQLQISDDRRIRLGAVSYGSGVTLAIAAALVDPLSRSAAIPLLAFGAAGLKLLGVVLVLDGLRIFRGPARASGLPTISGPVRRWVRTAFGWLLLAAFLGALYALPTLLNGMGITVGGFFEAGAVRHAMGQGFLLTLLTALGARMLPGYSAWAIRHPRVAEVIFGLVTAGATLRVAGEIGLAQGIVGSASVAALGGGLGTAGFLTFACLLFVTVGARRNSKGTPTP